MTLKLHSGLIIAAQILFITVATAQSLLEHCSSTYSDDYFEDDVFISFDADRILSLKGCLQYQQNISENSDCTEQNRSDPSMNESHLSQHNDTDECIVVVNSSDAEDLVNKIKEYPKCRLQLRGIYYLPEPLIVNSILESHGEWPGLEGFNFHQYPMQALQVQDTRHSAVVLSGEIASLQKSPGAILFIEDKIKDKFITLMENADLINIGIIKNEKRDCPKKCSTSGIRTSGSNRHFSIAWPEELAYRLCARGHYAPVQPSVVIHYMHKAGSFCLCL